MKWEKEKSRCLECGFVLVKDDGKVDRKLGQQKQQQAVAGKDKSDRGDDLGVRTVQNKHNESEVTNDNVASGFFGLEWFVLQTFMWQT